MSTTGLSTSGASNPPHPSSASNSTPQKEWLALLPDHPGNLSHRLSVRSQHLSDIHPQIGINAVLGGALLDHHPTEEETKAAGTEQGPQMNGSILIYTAETEEQVWEMIKKDVYGKEGVWDLGNAKVWAMKSAFRVGT